MTLPNTSPPRGTELDVCLFNGRPYVQGTQVLARACALLDPKQTWLTQAKFTRLTDRSVIALPAEVTNAPADTIGSIHFRQAEKQVDFQLAEASHGAPARAGATNYKIVLIQDDGALSGKFSFTCEANFEGVLDAIVQGVKALHLSLGAAITDVWFTGLRGFSLPLDMSGFRGAGVAHVARLRVLRSLPQHQSLMRVAIHLAGMEPMSEGMITFAFNPGDSLVD